MSTSGRQSGQVCCPLIQCCALLRQVLVGVVSCDDAGLGMVQTPLGDIGAHSQPRQPGPDRARKIVQREGGDLVICKGFEMSGDAPGQKPGISGAIPGLGREYASASVGQALQNGELDSRTNAP